MGSDGVWPSSTREIAEPILQEWVGEGAELRWMSGCPRERVVRIEELEEDGVAEWTGGSRVGGSIKT